jgi:hypothetical protein
VSSHTHYRTVREGRSAGNTHMYAESSKTYPAYKLDEVGVERNAGFGIKDGRFGGADKVGRNDLIFGIAAVG